MRDLLRPIAVIFCLAVALLGLPARAQGPLPPPSTPKAAALPGTPTPRAGTARLTAADAEAWLDGYMPYALKRGGVAGAVVVVVKDGGILLEKGYGVSDTKTGAPVDPKSTLFRPGSVSKLFTWTAVMQQVEAGKIDLDADVNRYIDFKIPPYQGKPVTMRNLMTHTPGFEESIKRLIVTDRIRIPTLHQVLSPWVPERVYAPGTVPAYSNYGAALAGYIVQRVSGEPFDQYVENHIFKPLGMAHSSFSQPLPPALEAAMSKGYKTADGEPQPYELVPMAPAGSLAATGDDMAKFMLAHLSANGGGLMRPATMAEMHDFRLPIFPAPLNAMALGFFEERINGHRGIGHGGDTGFFHSHLHIWPDSGVGLFVSLNSAGRQGASANIRDALWEGFADRYLPGPEPDGQIDPKLAADHARLLAAQSYIPARGSFSSLFAIGGLAGQSHINVNADGTISPSVPLNYDGSPKRFHEIAPFVWREVGGHDLLGAKVRDGHVLLWATSIYAPAIASMPAGPGRSSGLIGLLFTFGTIVILGTALFWPINAAIRRNYRGAGAFPLEGARATAFRWSRRMTVVAALAILGWLALLGALSSADLATIIWLGDNDAAVLALETLTLIGFLGGLVTAIWYALTTVASSSTWFAKLWSVCLVIAMAGALWLAHIGGLLSFSTNY